jgi:hypothetical protein
MTKTAASRIPAMISGRPSGSSTPVRICRSVSPIPRAASTTSRSTPSTPRYAFVRIGGIPITTSATVLLQKPTPRTAIRRPMTTRTGSARPRVDTPSAKPSPV